MGNEEADTHSGVEAAVEQLSNHTRGAVRSPAETGSSASGGSDTESAADGPDIRIGSEAAVTVGPDSGADTAVGRMRADDWLERVVTVHSAGTYDVTLGVAAPHEKAVTLEVSVGDTDLGPVAVPRTESWVDATTVTVPGQALSAGEQVLRIAVVEAGGDGDACYLQWIEVTDSDHETIPGAIDRDDDGTIEGGAILSALDHRRDGTPVPNTDGETVTDGVVLDLVERWTDETQGAAGSESVLRTVPRDGES